MNNSDDNVLDRTGMVSFDSSLPMMMHRTLDSVMPEYRALFAHHNLTEQQWRILRVLWDSKRVTSAELSTRTLLPAPSLVGIIDRLVKKQLVARERSEDDRRIVFVAPTAKGQKLEAEVRPQVEQINQRIQSTVTEQEWDSLHKILTKITDGLGAEPSSSKL